jgi:hypothetical protein
MRANLSSSYAMKKSTMKKVPGTEKKEGEEEDEE